MKDHKHVGKGNRSKKDLETHPETSKGFTQMHENDDEQVLQNNDSPGDGSKGDDIYRVPKNENNDLPESGTERIP